MRVPDVRQMARLASDLSADRIRLNISTRSKSDWGTTERVNGSAWQVNIYENNVNISNSSRLIQYQEKPWSDVHSTAEAGGHEVGHLLKNIIMSCGSTKFDELGVWTSRDNALALHGGQAVRNLLFPKSRSGAHYEMGNHPKDEINSERSLSEILKDTYYFAKGSCTY